MPVEIGLLRNLTLLHMTKMNLSGAYGGSDLKAKELTINTLHHLKVQFQPKLGCWKSCPHYPSATINYQVRIE